MAEWISVKERLPKKHGEYLCYCTDGFGRCVSIYSFAKNLSKVDDYYFEGIKRAGWYSYDSELGYIEMDDVTHWMPLPDAPQKEGD